MDINMNDTQVLREELAIATSVLADSHERRIYAEQYAYQVELEADQLTFEVDHLTRQLVHARRAAEDLGGRLASANRRLTNLAAIPPPAAAPPAPPRVRQTARKSAPAPRRRPRRNQHEMLQDQTERFAWYECKRHDSQWPGFQ